MALDVYFKQDILNILRATYVAHEGPASLMVDLLQDRELCAALDAADVPLEKLLQIYRQGFCTALSAVGLAFGVVPEGQPVRERRDPSTVRSATGPVSGERLSGGNDTCLDDGADLCDLGLGRWVWAKAQWDEQRR